MRLFTIGFIIVLTFAFAPLSFAVTENQLTDEQYQRLLLLRNKSNATVNGTATTEELATGEPTTTTVSRLGAVNGGNVSRHNVNSAQRAENNTGVKVGAGANHRRN